jgi:hypothetical protein
MTMNEWIRLFCCEKVARCTWSNQNCPQTTRNTYISSEYLLRFLIQCSRSFGREDTETRVASENFSRQLCMVFLPKTTPNLVKLVLPVLQCLVPASLYRSANDETFCDRASLGILTFRFHQWKALSGSGSCFVHLVFCSFWNYCLFISRYGFISRGYHSLINFWKGPPMMRSIQLTAKLVFFLTVDGGRRSPPD